MKTVKIFLFVHIFNSFLYFSLNFFGKKKTQQVCLFVFLYEKEAQILTIKCTPVHESFYSVQCAHICKESAIHMSPHNKAKIRN